MTNGEPNKSWLNPHVSIGDILQIIVFIALMAIAYANLSSHQITNDLQTAANTQAIKSLAEGQEKQNKALELMIQRLEDYPLHLHPPNGGAPIYPNGRRNQP